MFWLVALVLVVAGACAGRSRFVWHAFNYEETDDAYVNGHVHQITPRIAGAVTEVLVDDNRTVKAGQVLARIDPLEYEIALHRAQAKLAQSQAEEVRAARRRRPGAGPGHAGAGAGRARPRRSSPRQAQLETANTDFSRNSRLYNNDQRAIAKSEVDTTKGGFDAAQAALNAARANVAGAQSNVAAAQAQVESAQATLAAAQATVAANEAAVRDAERELSYADAHRADGRPHRQQERRDRQPRAGRAGALSRSSSRTCGSSPTSRKPNLPGCTPGSRWR